LASLSRSFPFYTRFLAPTFLDSMSNGGFSRLFSLAVQLSHDSILDWKTSPRISLYIKPDILISSVATRRSAGRPISQAEQESLDQRILGIVSSLCQQLGITNYNPQIVAWVSFIPRGRAMVEMPFDEAILSNSQIMLPAAMRDKLEPEEWKPIIASALIVSKKLRRKMIGRTLMGLGVLAAISVTLFLTLPILLPGLVTTCSKSGSCGQEPLGFMIASFGILIPLVGTPILGVLFGRKVKLAADRMAGKLVGTVYFLGVVNKIASIAGGQASARKRISGPLSPFPSLQSRILNLQSYTGPS
jgi:hypothetical protein